MQLTADISKGPRSAVLCLLHRLLEGSQKLKPEGVNRFVTQQRHLKGRKKKKKKNCACVSAVGVLVCKCIAELNLCVRAYLLMAY